VLALLVAVLAADAAADPAAPLWDAFDRGDYVAVLKAAPPAVQAHPENGALRHVWGAALAVTSQYVRAAEELERAVALTPGDADAWWRLGMCQGILGNEAGARASQERALALDPRHEDATLELAELAIRERIRRGDRPALDPAGPTHAALDCLGQLAEYSQRLVLERCFDAELIEELATRMKIPEKHRWRGLSGAVDGFRKGFEDGGQHFVGSLADVTAEVIEGQKATVTIRVLFETVTTEKMVEVLRQKLEDPRFASAVKGDGYGIFASLPREERDQFLRAMVGRKTAALATVNLDMRAGEDGRWRIRDLTAGQSGAMTVKLGDLLAAGVFTPEEGSSGAEQAYQAGKLVGRVLGIFLFCVIAVKVGRWVRRRL
jgi:tetratricopeptide (TPR) repeat protein